MLLGSWDRRQTILSPKEKIFPALNGCQSNPTATATAAFELLNRL
jgi:hypothetical protein